MIATQLELHIGYVYDTIDAPTDPSAYTPKYIPGARLPHQWIRPLPEGIGLSVSPVDLSHVHELSQEQRSARQYSTLDLCRFDTFTFITNSSQAQVQRATEVGHLLSVKSPITNPVPLQVIVLDVDFEFVFPDRAKEWFVAFNLGAGGGVIVRPDQHIQSIVDNQTTAQQIVASLNMAVGL